MRSFTIAIAFASCIAALFLSPFTVHASVNRAALQPLTTPSCAQSADRILGSVRDSPSIGIDKASSSSLQLRSTAKNANESRAILSKGTFTSLTAYMMGVSMIVCDRRYDCFATVMTGQIINLMSSMAQLQWREVAKCASILAGFGSGVALFRTVDVSIKKNYEFHSKQIVSKTARPISPSKAVVVAPLVLGLICLADIIFVMSLNSDSVGSAAVGSIVRHLPLPSLGMAFGFCNSAASDASGGIITYAMTGHTTTIFRSLADGGLVGKARTSAKALAGFAAGIASATLAVNLLESKGSGIPSLALSSLGVIFALLLVMRSRPEDLRAGMKILLTRPPRYAKPAVDVFVKQRDISSPYMTCMMDGWTTMPSGPAPFQDGS
uniref:H(+)-exporting diphosphatase n=1 Tax=Odontella aurita TaxID=265563 RepID=A0A7S4HWA5_9STRA|mmetsp:Transcript_16179/g.46651  ORF Transcript_16179/g.46651 Transcript_16179/m.46651 type:complete len:380 (+) Transcript_16179:211-1350(+)|eukprot:CAMPEP_0113525384 /NCGR_PEP_ID=MMETSP0015_2-20120614/129_1 /TAXON_ID=2838 /ORGANISM="Odontella" /LENGTH=379 /DNA_ID=CAMNT_0000423539 /DNA_START=210 /DNA_END=1349 /DNA_ORIENTATION=- /assembly_acc=CAM_ASM_000160